MGPCTSFGLFVCRLRAAPGVHRFPNYERRKTGDEWAAEALASAKHDLEYHTKHNTEEVARTRQRNKWVRDLRDSLK